MALMYPVRSIYAMVAWDVVVLFSCALLTGARLASKKSPCSQYAVAKLNIH